MLVVLQSKINTLGITVLQCYSAANPGLQLNQNMGAKFSAGLISTLLHPEAIGGSSAGRKGK